MELTSEIRDHIVEHSADTGVIMQLMRQNGFLSIAEDGVIKMLDKKTTIEELRRVI